RTWHFVRELEREVTPVVVLQRPDVDLGAEHLLLKPDRNGLVAHIAVRRPAEDALDADELGRDVHPARFALDVHDDRSAIAAPIAPSDGAYDPASPCGRSLVE